MKIQVLLLSTLVCLAAIAAGATYNEDLRIAHDPLTGPNAYKLSWRANAGILYTLEGNETLQAPWIALAQEAGLQDDELAEWGLATDADRYFVRLLMEEDNGIRIFATCEAGAGVLIEVDGSAWANENQWDWIDSLVIERASNPEGPFTPIQTFSYPPDWIGSFFDHSAELEETHYYRARFTYYTESTYHEAPLSNVAQLHVTCTASGPELVASCRNDRIILEWQAPEWATPERGVSITNWTLRRQDFPDPLPTNTPWGAMNGSYLDAAVSTSVAYSYHVSFTYTGSVSGQSLTSPDSAVVETSTCEPPELGPIDVAFIVDNTTSLWSALDTVLGESEPNAEDAEIDLLLDGLVAASNGDYRLALVTPNTNYWPGDMLEDIVHVRVPFSWQNRTTFRDGLRTMEVWGGGGQPESTDECLNTVVKGLLEGDRPGDPEIQINDFQPEFDDIRSNEEVLKLVVVITDDVPGGFYEDVFDQQIWCNARKYALDAKDKNIRIAAVQIGNGTVTSNFSQLDPCGDPRDGGGNEAYVDLKAVMEFYADTTCGWHFPLDTSAHDFAEELLEVLVYSEYPECP